MMPNTADIAAQAGVRVKQLEWFETYHDDDGDQMHTAATPFGNYTVERFDGRWRWKYLFAAYHDEDEFSCDDLADGQSKASAHWADRIAPMFEPAPILAAIEPQAVAETLHGPFGWLNGRRELSEEHWTLERDPLENSDEHFAIPLFAKVDPFQEAKPDALDHLLNFIVSDDTPVRPEDEADLRLFNEATMEGIAKFALRAAAASPVTASDAPANVEDEFFYDPRTGRVAGSEHVTASDERAVEAEVANAEIEWSYHEDDNRYPRDFWHARIDWRGFRTTWCSYGEQEQRHLPDEVKSAAETDLRSELRAALSAALAAAPLPAGPSSKGGGADAV